MLRLVDLGRVRACEMLERKWVDVSNCCHLNDLFWLGVHLIWVGLHCRLNSKRYLIHGENYIQMSKKIIQTRDHFQILQLTTVAPSTKQVSISVSSLWL